MNPIRMKYLMKKKQNENDRYSMRAKWKLNIPETEISMVLIAQVLCRNAFLLLLHVIVNVLREDQNEFDVSFLIYFNAL